MPAERLEDGAPKLRDLVEKEYAVVCEAYLSGARELATAAHEGELADRVVRRAKGMPRTGRRHQEPRHAVDRRHLQGFGRRERRQDPRQTPGEHDLARARRTDQKERVPARRSHFERASSAGEPADL
jgi:hypothetical protein